MCAVRLPDTVAAAVVVLERVTDVIAADAGGGVAVAAAAVSGAAAAVADSIGIVDGFSCCLIEKPIGKRHTADSGTVRKAKMLSIAVAHRQQLQQSRVVHLSSTCAQ